MSEHSANAPDADAQANRNADREINRIAGWRLLALWPASLLVRLWLATLRVHTDESTREQLLAGDPSRIFLIWHNQLFMAAELHRRFRKHRPIAGLISASKDGAWLAAFYQLLGIGYIRGSSSKRGARALVDCLHALRNGSDLTITPDGPRGPRYSMKPGAAFLARKAEAPLCCAAVRFRRAKRLGSWDGFFLPLPFSRVDVLSVTYESFDAIREAFPEGKDDAEALRQALLAINSRCE